MSRIWRTQERERPASCKFARESPRPLDFGERLVLDEKFRMEFLQSLVTLGVDVVPREVILETGARLQRQRVALHDAAACLAVKAWWIVGRVMRRCPP
mgnify:CR=1 FL=1